MRGIAFTVGILVLVLAARPATAGQAQAGVQPVGKIEQVLVVKSERRLFLLRNGEVIRSYVVALGSNPLGRKTSEGDGRTPEGRYVIDWRNPRSRFYRSLHISYPSDGDRRRAQAGGVAPGGEIMLHGLPNGREAVGADHVRWDWTEGCIALTNAEMDEIWQAIDDGTPIEIRP